MPLGAWLSRLAVENLHFRKPGVNALQRAAGQASTLQCQAQRFLANHSPRLLVATVMVVLFATHGQSTCPAFACNCECWPGYVYIYRSVAQGSASIHMEFANVPWGVMHDTVVGSGTACHLRELARMRTQQAMKAFGADRSFSCTKSTQKDPTLAKAVMVAVERFFHKYKVSPPMPAAKQVSLSGIGRPMLAQGSSSGVPNPTPSAATRPKNNVPSTAVSLQPAQMGDVEQKVALQTAQMGDVEQKVASTTKLLTEQMEEVTRCNKQDVVGLLKTASLLADAGITTEQSLDECAKDVHKILHESDNFKSELACLRGELATMASHQKELVEIFAASNAIIAEDNTKQSLGGSAKDVHQILHESDNFKSDVHRACLSKG